MRWRLPRPLLTIAALALAAGPAIGAPGDKPKPRPKPPAAQPAADAGLRPALDHPLGPPPRVFVSLPPPIQAGGAFTAGGLGSGGLASGGLRSSLPVTEDPTAQCRTACSRGRITCEAQDGGPECSPKWAMCVAHCNRR